MVPLPEKETFVMIEESVNVENANAHHIPELDVISLVNFVKRYDIYHTDFWPMLKYCWCSHIIQLSLSNFLLYVLQNLFSKCACFDK